MRSARDSGSSFRKKKGSTFFSRAARASPASSPGLFAAPHAARAFSLEALVARGQLVPAFGPLLFLGSCRGVPRGGG
jgi:hypothetical protein